jgi:hypothetical protein
MRSSNSIHLPSNLLRKIIIPILCKWIAFDWDKTSMYSIAHADSENEREIKATIFRNVY